MFFLHVLMKVAETIERVKSASSRCELADFEASGDWEHTSRAFAGLAGLEVAQLRNVLVNKIIFWSRFKSVRKKREGKARPIM